MAGINVRMSNITKAVTMVWHVVLVHPNGPAATAGLESGTDFVIGVPGFMFFHPDDFYNQVKVNLNKPLPMYVYSTKSKTVRIVTVTPDHNWGGNGFLGCDVAYGLNHQLVTAMTSAPSIPATPEPEIAKASAPVVPVAVQAVAPIAPPKPVPVAVVAPREPTPVSSHHGEARGGGSPVVAVTRADRANNKHQHNHHHPHDGPCNHSHDHDHDHDHHDHEHHDHDHHGHDHSHDHEHHDHSHDGHKHAQNGHVHGESCNHDHDHAHKHHDHSHDHGHEHKHGEACNHHGHEHAHPAAHPTAHHAHAAPSPNSPQTPVKAAQPVAAAAPSTPTLGLQQVTIDYQPSQLFSPFHKLPGHYYATPLPEELNNGEDISFQARFGN